jgi:hypothetical protein
MGNSTSSPPSENSDQEANSMSDDGAGSNSPEIQAQQQVMCIYLDQALELSDARDKIHFVSAPARSNCLKREGHHE